MDRDILFKAKRLSDGEWVEGYFYRVSEQGFIMHGPANDANGSSEVLLSTVCQYINIDTREECCTGFESHKIFTGDMLGEWGEDEDGNECICILGIVTYWESEGRYVLTDKDGLCNDWTLEDEAQPVNWPKLIHCGSIHDGEGGQHE